MAGFENLQNFESFHRHHRVRPMSINYPDIELVKLVLYTRII